MRAARGERGAKRPAAGARPWSSVGSIVCYLTGLSHVDPVGANLSLGRFLNHELASVPDIDLDFPRDIRERLIVEVTERYGREHAALVATFSTYHARGAIRDVGKALGLPAAELERLARVTDGDPRRVADELARLPGADAKLVSRRWRALGWLCKEIAGLPRHISQHPGGMVISSRPLVELVPVEPAAMEGRQICQWDKDSCADAGFLKIDLLGLGMLSAIEDCVERIATAREETVDLSRIQLDDPGVYEEIQHADTVGTFQIESRAQMQSLLRTRPANLDDLTVQVALVRPGPIQGGAVHPYIDRRARRRVDPDYPIEYDHPLLEEPLAETFGVVVFQDQVLEVAMALAGFSIGEAEGLRRAMSRKRSEEAIEAFRARFVEGAARNGVDAKTASEVYDKLAAFSGFGFPKSHAAAFALLAYQSSWLRRYYPAEFLCALLNAQPMGFYPPASLVRDAQRRGVTVRPPDVNVSDAACTIEAATTHSGPVPGTVPGTEVRNSIHSDIGRELEWAVRVGVGYVAGVGEAEAEAVASGRPYLDIRDLAQRAPVERAALQALVSAGACDSFGEPRRRLLWQLGLVPRPQRTAEGGSQLALPLEPTTEIPELREQTAWERMLADYRGTNISVGPHPLELLRPHLPPGTVSSAELGHLANGSTVRIAGMAIARQRPATAHGIVFMLLEDEHGLTNLVVQPELYERRRALVRGEPLLTALGRLEKVGLNINVVVAELESLAPLARELAGLAEVRSALPRAHHFGHR